MLPTAVEISNLSIGYSGRGKTKTVAKGLTASIKKAELTCLIGANGVGKSTLLKTLSAFLPKLSGAVTIFGKSIDEYSNKDLAKAIGVVLTDKIDVRDLTVRDLVGMGRSPYTDFWGNLQKEDNEIIDESIRLVGIESLAKQSIQDLSDGEKQKTMIAKALAQQTPIIFLDEPTAFLDYPSKVEIIQLMRQLTHSTQRTFFFSTHDLELALQLSDKLWLMDKQHGIRVGTTDELTKNGALTTFFNNQSIVFDTDRKLFRIVK